MNTKGTDGLFLLVLLSILFISTSLSGCLFGAGGGGGGGSSNSSSSGSGNSGNGSGGGGDSTPFASIELIDPTSGTSNFFGSQVVILSNNNVVVTDPQDSTMVANGGAVHLYSPRSPNPISSIYGDVAGDQLGSSGVTALANNNYVIVSEFDDESGVVNAGSVRLVDGDTGEEINMPMVGDVMNDNLGSSGITALMNNNYVIASELDDEGGVVNAGSVRLVNGSTGVAIGTPVVGDDASDLIGSGGIAVLENNNFVSTSEYDDEGGVVNAGSVCLMDGGTGAVIGTPLAGNDANDYLGGSGIVALGNNNYVVASELDDEGGVVNAGSVRLVNGSTGAAIGTPLVGDVVNDYLGSSVTALENNNFVIASEFDDEGGVVDAGSVRLVDGGTGTSIGKTMAGDVVNDYVGSSITVLGNNNYVVTSEFDDEGGIVNAGSVHLVDGSTGDAIGSPMVGDDESDYLGYSGITVLENDNYVIASQFDDEGGIRNAGSVQLVDGSTGVAISTPMVGDVMNDNLGSSSVTALMNNNYVIASSSDDESGISNAGSVRLIDGNTGMSIGIPVVGDAVNDQIGLSGVTALMNNNYVVASVVDDEGGILNAGSARIVNGDTGVETNMIVGGMENDFNGVTIAVPAVADFMVVGLSEFDNNGLMDSGMVNVIAPGFD